MQETVLSHLFVPRRWFTIVGVWIDADAATGDKNACHLDVLRLHETDEVFHDNIDTVLMEAAVITEAEEIEFEALALNHLFVRKIADAYLCEVRLAGNGA